MRYGVVLDGLEPSTLALLMPELGNAWLCHALIDKPRWSGCCGNIDGIQLSQRPAIAAISLGASFRRSRTHCASPALLGLYKSYSLTDTINFRFILFKIAILLNEQARYI
jgi:hypothetical protein